MISIEGVSNKGISTTFPQGSETLNSPDIKFSRKVRPSICPAFEKWFKWKGSKKNPTGTMNKVGQLWKRGRHSAHLLL